MARICCIVLRLGNILQLKIRPDGLRNLLFNWDLDIYRLGITVCWFRQAKLIVVLKSVTKPGDDGKRSFTGLHRFWALGWSGWAFSDKGRGEASGSPDFRTIERGPLAISIDGSHLHDWINHRRSHARHQRARRRTLAA